MNKFLRIMSTVLMMILAFTATMSFAIDDFSVTATAPGDNGQSIANSILSVVQWIGYAIAIGMLIYIGIKYVMAGANEKADLKGALIKYVIGAILIAGAVTVAKAIFSVGTQFTAGGE